MLSILEIINDGPDIVKTNFFDSEYAENGYFYLSTNAGHVRLLIPDSQKNLLKELKNVAYAILSRGPWIQRDVLDAIELMFEDFSNSPYAIHMTAQQCDMLPEIGEEGKGDWKLSLWLRSGNKQVFSLKCRKVDKIPCLKPWMELPKSGYHFC
jgi:hypothetical protein